MAMPSTPGDSYIDNGCNPKSQNQKGINSSTKPLSQSMIEVSSYIDTFKSEIDENSVKADFPEITESETPIWRGKPSLLSMMDKYILATIVLFIHLAFFFGAWLDPPEGGGQANFVFALLMWIVNNTGVVGFVLAMLTLTKLNHYGNFSTSGRWTTIWLLISSLFPLIWKLMDIFQWFSGLLNLGFQNPLPSWSFSWFLPIGFVSFAIMASFTVLYQNAFQYVITNKRIHLRKKFLYLDSNIHGIPYSQVENLKSDPSVIGRIFGFGNVHIITSSGVGLQSESTGMSIGVGNDEANPSVGPIPSVFGWVSKQRQRSVMAKDPADCLFGIRNPMDVYRLINDLIDNEAGSTVDAPVQSE